MLALESNKKTRLLEDVDGQPGRGRPGANACRGSGAPETPLLSGSSTPHPNTALGGS